MRHGEVSDLVANYGHLIVDECHHQSAVSFELVARRAKARFVLGLSATVARKDGRRPIIFMLFLTMPISWQGTLAQYVGRLHRQRDGKADVLVVDYVDELVQVLARMATKRRAGYRALGYRIE